MTFSTISNVFVTATSKLGATGLSTVSAILIANMLGKEGLGLFALLRVIPAILVVLTEMGVSQASSYLINNRRYDPRLILGNAMFVWCFVAVANVLFWLAASRLIGNVLLRELPSHWLLAAAFIAPMVALCGIAENVLRATQNFRLANSLQISVEASMVACLAFLAVSGWLSVGMLVLCIVVARTSALAFGMGCLVSKGLKPIPLFQKRLLIESLRFGIRNQLANAVNIVNYRLDYLILSVLTDTGTVGIYAVASKAAELFRLIPGSVGYVLEPKLAKQSPLEASQTVKRLAAWVFLSNLVLLSLAFVVGPIVIPIIFTSWSADSLMPFRILVVGLAATGVSGLISAFNLGQGRPEFTFYAVAIGLLFTISLDIMLIPAMGASGAAIASAIAYAVSAGAMACFYVFQHTKIISREVWA